MAPDSPIVTTFQTFASRAIVRILPGALRPSNTEFISERLRETRRPA